jgi:hypothetical protein
MGNLALAAFVVATSAVIDNKRRAALEQRPAITLELTPAARSA